MKFRYYFKKLPYLLNISALAVLAGSGFDNKRSFLKQLGIHNGQQANTITNPATSVYASIWR